MKRMHLPVLDKIKLIKYNNEDPQDEVTQKINQDMMGTNMRIYKIVILKSKNNTRKSCNFIIESERFKISAN